MMQQRASIMLEKTQANLLRTIRELKKRLHAQDEQLARFKQRPATPPSRLRQKREVSETPSDFAHWFAANVIPALGIRLAMVVVDRSGRIRSIFGNGAGAIAAPEAVIGTAWVDWLAPADQPRWRAFTKNLDPTKSGEPLSFHIKPEFGGLMTAKAYPGKAKAGETWVVLSEISLDKAAPDNNPARHWAGVYAHELNQPLTAVLTTAQACRSLLSSGRMPVDEMLQGMDAIIRRGRHAADVVRRLRTLAGGETPARVSCNLNEIVKRGLDLLQAPLEQSRTRVTLELAEELPNVKADSVQIVQIVVNLVRNAIEAMSSLPVSRRQVTVRTRSESREAIVSVEDQGIGLSVDIVQRLFQPIASTKSSGMGLGLAICRQIVEAHGGRIWAKGNVPRGCVFSFSVPFHDEES